MSLQLSEDLVELDLVGLVSAKIEDKIPFWFDRSDTDLLIDALNGGHLDDELGTIADDVQSKSLPAIMTMVNDMFRGRYRPSGMQDTVADRAFMILSATISGLRYEIAGYDYEEIEREIKKAETNLKKLKAVLRERKEKIKGEEIKCVI